MQRGHTIATIFINVDLGRGWRLWYPFNNISLNHIFRKWNRTIDDFQKGLQQAKAQWNIMVEVNGVSFDYLHHPYIVVMGNQ